MTPARLRVDPTDRIEGELEVPGDKSVSHRALLFSALAEGRSRIANLLVSDDVMATAQAVAALGCAVTERGGIWQVDGGALRDCSEPLDCQNAGTLMRLIAGLGAGQNLALELDGDASLRRRPMERIALPLRQMGARIRTGSNGLPPLILSHHEGLEGIAYKSPVASAQVKSAVLLAGLGASGETYVAEPGPSRDHSERLLAHMGVELRCGDRGVGVRGGSRLVPSTIDVPGDLSSAAFWIGAGLLSTCGTLQLRNVGVNPTRTGLLDALSAMGAPVAIHDRQDAFEPTADLEVKPASLHGVDLPAELAPRMIDEYPLLFVMAACAEGVSCLRGLAELRVKESDRVGVMSKALKELGAVMEVRGDDVWISGVSRLRGGRVDAAGDHRCAMALAVAAVRASESVEIEGAQHISTSYPEFIQHARHVGLGIGGGS